VAAEFPDAPPPPATYTVGGTVTGLSGRRVVRYRTDNSFGIVYK
jgi:hypothetical protein